MTATGDLTSPGDARPIAPTERIDAIDIVRGIALFGVMAINVVTVFRVSIFEQFLPARADGSALDRALHSVLMIGVDLKAFALFSLLFGVGLAIQFEHLSESSRRLVLLVRRLAFLMLVGAIHLILIWNGDILLEYAIAGLVVLPLLFGPTRILTFAGLILLAVFIASPFLPSIAAMPSRSWMVQIVADAARVYAAGSFSEVLAFRIHELPGFWPLHVSMFPRTVALMLLGAALWRSGLFKTGSKASRFLPWMTAVGLVGGGALAILHAQGRLGLGWQMESSLERLGTCLLAWGYGAALVLAAAHARGRALLAWAAPVGRMAFTNYVMQSVIFGWIFYGYGLGLFGRLGVATALAIGAGVCVLQVVFSILWLRRFRFGPVEWLWRSMMYGAWQPMRRAVQTRATCQ
jgi:uncharacterized protein